MDNRDYFQEETIDIKEIIHKAWRHWKLFLISVIIGIIIVFYINKKQPTIYETYTTVLVNDKNSSLDPQALLGLDLYNSKSKIQNEIEILKSQSLINKAFKKLNFDVTYIVKNRFLEKELYTRSPFKVNVDSNFLQPINYKIGVEIITKDSIIVSFPNDLARLHDFKIDKTYDLVELINNNFIVKSADTISGNYFGFNITLTDFYNPSEHINQKFYFILNDFQSKLNQFKDLNYEIIDKSSVIKVSLKHYNLQKSVDFLNELTRAYIHKELKRKNTVADKSLEFIKTHMNEINDSLYKSEKSLQEFQASKSALNIDFQTQKMFNQLENLQNQKAEALITQKYYIYLQQTLKESKLVTDIIAPSIMNINNPILTTQITNLINTQSELNNLKVSSNITNPYTGSLISRIENSKNVIIEYVQNEKKNLDITLADIDLRIDVVIEKINDLPKTQRELFNFERSFKVYDNIYTFLLQKRSETLLTKASNLPTNEIIDQAKLSSSKIVSRNTKMNYMIGLIISLLLPSIFIYIKYYFNSKILTDKDIENETSLPILGHILKSKDEINAFHNTKSPLAESFRMFRTNLYFAKKTSASQTILISSTMQGEGKSFVSNNLALSLAFANKKTVLLVFDLRKPKLYIDVTKKEHGLTNFLINDCSLGDIIQPTDYNNLDIIQAGILPPNPSELILSNNTDILFEELRKIYDYIIIDTPPIGIIADGVLLTKYSDTNIIVTRYNYTRIKLFADLIKRIQSNKVKNLNLVTNYLETNKKGYGYGYSYGSYENYQ